MSNPPDDEPSQAATPSLARLAHIFGKPTTTMSGELTGVWTPPSPSLLAETVPVPSSLLPLHATLGETPSDLVSSRNGGVEDLPRVEKQDHPHATNADQSTEPRQYPEVSVRDFVQRRECSVRLRNRIVTSDLFSDWSVAAALKESDQFRQKLSEVNGLGRKSIDELFELLLSLHEDAPPKLQVLDKAGTHAEVQIVSTGAANTNFDISQSVLNVPIGLALRFFGCSVRLGKAIERAQLDNAPIADFLSEPSVIASGLRDVSGVGRQSTVEAFALLERFLDAAARRDPAVLALLEPAEGGSPAVEKLNTPEQPRLPSQADSALPDSCSPRERMARVVAALPERESFILARRYGLDGAPGITLQDIAEEKHVTRERVRQLEAKALRSLRLLVHQPLLAEFLRTEQAAIWNILSAGSDLVTDTELRDTRRKIDPWQALAIDVVHDGIDGWLARNATHTGAGWLRRGLDPELLQTAERRITAIAAAHALPMLLETVMSATELTRRAVEAAAENSAELSIFEGYLCSGRAGVQIRRTIRLHRLACNMATQPFDIATLAAAYWANYPDDQFSSRMFQLHLEDAPHLFCRLFDCLWFALPAQSGRAIGSAMPYEWGAPLVPSFEPRSIGFRLAEQLADTPRRHVDLRAAREDFDGRVAESSIGAILSSNPCFRRVAPGIFDIGRAGSVYNEHGVLNEFFLDDRQCRAYCFARYGGAPIDWYPAWGPSFELWLMRWARLRAEPDLYRSLLHVAEPSVWQAPADELDFWRRTKDRDSAWLIGAPRRTALGRRFVDPDQFLATLGQLALFGWMCWMAANRTTDARGDIHDAADVLALLIKADLVVAPADWQQVHKATDRVAELFAQACREMHETGSLDWDRGVLADLWTFIEGNAASDECGWLDNSEFAMALPLWRSGEARASRAFTRKPQEPVDPAPIFETEDWDRLFRSS